MFRVSQLRQRQCKSAQKSAGSLQQRGYVKLDCSSPSSALMATPLSATSFGSLRLPSSGIVAPTKVYGFQLMGEEKSVDDEETVASASTPPTTPQAAVAVDLYEEFDEATVRPPQCDPLTEESYPPSFTLSTVLTSPSNRSNRHGSLPAHFGDMSNVLPDESYDQFDGKTPKMTNTTFHPTNDNAPNFSLVASPVAKKENHTVNIELSTDWSFDIEEDVNLVKDTSQWVTFEPFESSIVEAIGDINVSFMSLVPQSENTLANGGVDGIELAMKFAYQLETLIDRLASLEGSLLGMENAIHLNMEAKQSNVPVHNAAFVFEDTDVMVENSNDLSDDFTCRNTSSLLKRNKRSRLPAKAKKTLARIFGGNTRDTQSCDECSQPLIKCIRRRSRMNAVCSIPTDWD
ncbi:predicted protein [Thalassiosira pseudonana CCMP1335]|uniref:Uncharacterized protein n=1 Tax=Thalassiosira pseudonana TaxID=35128 RepID=B8C9J7_THAPS|nr:predicted protein [Thalassiosira pseudonana CCMP1335]EED89872.1 predicted protein [Thalassiosira pseudonana CCMP1335]